MKEHMNRRLLLAVAGLMVGSLPLWTAAAFAAAETPDDRAFDLRTVCRGGTRHGEACSLDEGVVDCDSDLDCGADGPRPDDASRPPTCQKGRCSDCPGGECVLKDVRTKTIKGVLTVISDGNVSRAGSDDAGSCSPPDSDVGTKALTVLLEVRTDRGNVMLAETYQNAADPTDWPRATGWTSSKNCIGNLCSDDPRDSEFHDLETFVLKDAQERRRVPGQTGEKREDVTVFLFQRPEATMANALRALFGRPPDEVPIITTLPKIVGTTAYCDSDPDLCPPTDYPRLGSVARFKVKVQFVKRASP